MMRRFMGHMQESVNQQLGYSSFSTALTGEFGGSDLARDSKELEYVPNDSPESYWVQ